MLKISSIQQRKLLRHGLLAVVGGATLGQCYKNLRDHPGTGRKIVYYTVAAGCCGSITGAAIASRIGRKMPLSILMQTLYWSVGSALYCNVRSTLSNKQLKYPAFRDNDEEPLKEIVISTLSSAYCFALFSLSISSNVVYILTSTTFGMIAGFAGHHIYEKLHTMRLEFLLKQNYPELMKKERDAENYVSEQVNTNPFYDGPRPKRHPIQEYLDSIVEDNRKRIEEARAAEG